MGVGSKYYYNWSCTNCDYKEGTVIGPLRIEPRPGILQSKIERRWCSKCQGLRNCFIGKGYEYKPGEEPNSKFPRGVFKNLDEIASRISETKNEIRLLENQKKPLFSFSSKNKIALDKLHQTLQLFERNHSQFIESSSICKELSERARDFYEKLKPSPKCLTCGSTDISNVEWNLDRHKCGGTFIRKNADIRYTVTEYERIQYNEYGDAVHSILPL